jgi:hypothetical protein
MVDPFIWENLGGGGKHSGDRLNSITSGRDENGTDTIRVFIQLERFKDSNE